MLSIAVVIVTYNSQPFFEKLMESLELQSRRPDRVVIVDSGSTQTDYLARAESSPLACTVLRRSNVGFAVGCNLGWAEAKGHDLVLFLNPDAFPTPELLNDAAAFLERETNQDVGIVTATLLGYDMATCSPTGLVDSTGIMQTWYGRCFDRDQNASTSVLERYTAPEEIPAVCGALMLARGKMLDAIADGDDLFDPGYFMYKEDIDLSWRAAKAGWRLVYDPGLRAYHCRGWKSRRDAPRKMRLLSARNDIRLFLRFPSPRLLYALAKYAAVWALNL